MLSRRNVIIGLLAGAVVLGRPAPASAQATRLKVVASFSILGDFVREVGGDRIDVAVLVGPNGDAHVFSPAPADGKKLAEAKVVFVNGLRLEGWIQRLIKASGTKAAVVPATKGIQPIEAKDEGEPGKGTGAHDHAGPDPHAWQDIGNAQLYVANIRDALVTADPAGKEVYAANAGAYLDRLTALDVEVRAAIEKIPAGRRRIITSHDAFGYFAKAYGMKFIAPQGVSTDAEASAKDVARIIRQIKAEKIPAVFLENVTDTRLAERIAKETGARIGGRVYSDALSEPGGPAATYLDMMRNNIRAFSMALSS